MYFSTFYRLAFHHIFLPAICLGRLSKLLTKLFDNYHVFVPALKAQLKMAQASAEEAEADKQKQTCLPHTLALHPFHAS